MTNPIIPVPAVAGGSSDVAGGSSGVAASGWTPVAGLTMGKLSLVLFDESRWRILRELAKGEALPVQELVRRTRKTRNCVQKSMGVLKEAKLVSQVYGHLYRLVPGIVASENGTRLDLGFCILCLDRIPG